MAKKSNNIDVNLRVNENSSIAEMDKEYKRLTKQLNKLETEIGNLTGQARDTNNRTQLQVGNAIKQVQKLLAVAKSSALVSSEKTQEVNIPKQLAATEKKIKEDRENALKAQRKYEEDLNKVRREQLQDTQKQIELQKQNERQILVQQKKEIQLRDARIRAIQSSIDKGTVTSKRLRAIPSGQRVSIPSQLNTGTLKQPRHDYEVTGQNKQIINAALEELKKTDGLIEISVTKAISRLMGTDRDFNKERVSLERQIASAQGAKKVDLDNQLKELDRLEKLLGDSGYVGTAFHKVAELFENGLLDLKKIQGFVGTPKELGVQMSTEIKKAMVKNVPHGFEGVALEEFSKLFGDLSQHGGSFAQLRKMLSLYQETKETHGITGNALTEKSLSALYNINGQFVRLSGTIDSLITAMSMIGDIKTTSSIHAPELRLQLGFGKDLLEASGEKGPNKGMVMSIPQKGNLADILEVEPITHDEVLTFLSRLVGIERGEATPLSAQERQELARGVKGSFELRPYTYTKTAKDEETGKEIETERTGSSWVLNNKRLTKWVKDYEAGWISLEDILEQLETLSDEAKNRFVNILYASSKYSDGKKIEQAQYVNQGKFYEDLRGVFAYPRIPTSTEIGNRTFITKEGEEAGGFTIGGAYLSDFIRLFNNSQEEDRKALVELFVTAIKEVPSDQYRTRNAILESLFRRSDETKEFYEDEEGKKQVLITSGTVSDPFINAVNDLIDTMPELKKSLQDFGEAGQWMSDIDKDKEPSDVQKYQENLEDVEKKRLEYLKKWEEKEFDINVLSPEEQAQVLGNQLARMVEYYRKMNVVFQKIAERRGAYSDLGELIERPANEEDKKYNEEILQIRKEIADKLAENYLAQAGKETEFYRFEQGKEILPQFHDFLQSLGVKGTETSTKYQNFKNEIFNFLEDKMLSSESSDSESFKRLFEKLRSSGGIWSEAVAGTDKRQWVGPMMDIVLNTVFSGTEWSQYIQKQAKTPNLNILEQLTGLQSISQNIDPFYRQEYNYARGKRSSQQILSDLLANSDLQKTEKDYVKQLIDIVNDFKKIGFSEEEVMSRLDLSVLNKEASEGLDAEWVYRLATGSMATPYLSEEEKKLNQEEIEQAEKFNKVLTANGALIEKIYHLSQKNLTSPSNILDFYHSYQKEVEYEAVRKTTGEVSDVSIINQLLVDLREERLAQIIQQKKEKQDQEKIAESDNFIISEEDKKLLESFSAKELTQESAEEQQNLTEAVDNVEEIVKQEEAQTEVQENLPKAVEALESLPEEVATELPKAIEDSSALSVVETSKKKSRGRKKSSSGGSGGSGGSGNGGIQDVHVTSDTPIDMEGRRITKQFIDDTGKLVLQQISKEIEKTDWGGYGDAEGFVQHWKGQKNTAANREQAISDLRRIMAQRYGRADGTVNAQGMKNIDDIMKTTFGSRYITSDQKKKADKIIIEGAPPEITVKGANSVINVTGSPITENIMGSPVGITVQGDITVVGNNVTTTGGSRGKGSGRRRKGTYPTTEAPSQEELANIVEMANEDTGRLMDNLMSPLSVPKTSDLPNSVSADKAVPSKDTESRLKEYLELLREWYDVQLKLNKLLEDQKLLQQKGETAKSGAMGQEIKSLQKLFTSLGSQMSVIQDTLSPKDLERATQARETAQLKYEYAASSYEAKAEPEAQLKAEQEYERLLKKRLDYEKQISSAQHQRVTSIYGTERNALDQVIALSSQEVAEVDKKLDLLRQSNLLRDDERKSIERQIELERQSQLAREGAKRQGAQSIWDVMKNDIKRSFTRIFDYGVAMQGINKIRQTLPKIIQLTKELDQTITNLRIVTGMSRKEAEYYMITYQKMGKQLHATTQEVAQSATTWLRQGYSVQEAGKLIEASMKLSKVAMMSTEESAKALTATLKGFKLATTEVERITDVLSKMDSQAAVTGQGVSEALSLIANSAQLAGYSLEEAAAMVSTIGEVTQQSMSTVGNAVKTLMARFGNVKAGAFSSMSLEDDGDTTDSINDIEKVLKAVGISIRTSSMQMRDMGDVLDDLADKWATLDTVTQNAIASAAAGTRQRNVFITLMNNYDRYKDLTDEAANSAGTTDKKFKGYADSIEATMKDLQNAWEKLTQQIAASPFIKGAVKFLTFIMDSLPTIVPMIAAIGAQFAALKVPEWLAKGKEKVWGEGQFARIFGKGISPYLYKGIREDVLTQNQQIDESIYQLKYSPKAKKGKTDEEIEKEIAKLEKKKTPWTDETAQSPANKNLTSINTTVGQILGVIKGNKIATQNKNISGITTTAAGTTLASNGTALTNVPGQQLKGKDANDYLRQQIAATIQLTQTTNLTNQSLLSNISATNQMENAVQVIKEAEDQGIITRRKANEWREKLTNALIDNTRAQTQETVQKGGQNISGIMGKSGSKESSYLQAMGGVWGIVSKLSGGAMSGLTAGMSMNEVGANKFASLYNKTGQTAEADTTDKLIQGVTTGVTTAGLALIPGVGPIISSVVGPLLGDFLGGLFTYWRHADELQRKQRVEEAQRIVEAVQGITSVLTDQSNLLDKGELYGGDLKAYEENVQAMIGLLREENSLREKFTEQLKRINSEWANLTLTDIQSLLLSGTQDEKESITKAYKLAQIQTERDATFAANEEMRHQAFELSNGPSVKSGLSSKWAGKAGSNYLNQTILANSNLVDRNWWGNELTIAGSTLEEKRKNAEELKKEIIKQRDAYADELQKQGIGELVAGDLAGGVASPFGIAGFVAGSLDLAQSSALNEYVEKLDQFISDTATVENEQYKLNKQLREYDVLLGATQSGVEDLSDVEKSRLGSEGLMQTIANAMEQQGVAVRDSAGYIKKEYRDSITSYLKSNTAFTDALTKSSLSLSQFTRAETKMNDVIKQTGISLRQFQDALKRGDTSFLSRKAQEVNLTTDQLVEFINTADPSNLYKFSNGLGITTDELHEFSLELGSVTLGDFLASLDEGNEKLKKLKENFESFAEVGTLTDDLVASVLESGSLEDIQALGDPQKRREVFLRQIKAQEQVMFQKRLQAMMENTNAFAGFRDLEGISSAIDQSTALSSAQKMALNSSDASFNTLYEVARYAQKNEDGSYVDDQLDYLIKTAEQQLNLAIETQKYHYLDEQAIEYTTSQIEKQISFLEQQKEVLSSINEQRQKELDYIKAQIALENAHKEKKRVYREGVGFVYEEDEEAIKTAQKNLDDLDRDKQQEELDLRIEELELQKEILEFLPTQDNLLALQENMELWASNLGMTNEQIQALFGPEGSATSSITGLTSKINDEMGKVETLTAAVQADTAERIKNQNDTAAATDLKPYLEALRTADEEFHAVDNKSGTNFVEYYKKQEAYNRALNNFQEEAKKYSSTTSADLAAKYGEDFSEEMIEGYRNAREDTKDTTVHVSVKGRGKGDSKQLANAAKDKTVDFDSQPMDEGYYQDQFDRPTHNTYVSRYDEKSKSWGEWHDLGKDVSYERMEKEPPFTVFFNNANANAWGIVGPHGGFYSVHKNAQGTLGLPASTPTLINELGTEAIITPQGTLTALPAKTGIVPADITKNLWALGEAAPNLVAQLSSLTSPVTQSISNSSDEGFYIDRMNLTLYATPGFDIDQFITQVKSRARLTRNNN